MSAFSRAQWLEISPYLDHVLSLSEKERANWLANFRAQRSDLADALELLLEEHQALSQEHFLEYPPEQPTSDNSLIGEILGPYMLTSRIGEGSMKGDVKRKSLSADWSGEFGLASSPCELNTTLVNTRVWHLFSTLWAREAKVIRRRSKLRGHGGADQGSIGGAEAYGFFRSSEEA